MKPKSHALALEVDRRLKLDLNNGRFEDLAIFLDGYQDSRKFTDELLASSREHVLSIVSQLRIK